MGQEEESIRQKILLATIACIEKEGFHALTTRSIAREANVNSAAINYYFSTKDHLIDEVLKSTSVHLYGDLKEILEQNKEPRELLKEFFLYILEGSQRFPGTVKAHFYDPLLKNKYDSYFVEAMNKLLALLFDKVSPAIPQEKRSAFRISVVQMVSAVFMPILLSNLFKGFSGLDFSIPEQVDTYIEHLLDRYLDA